MKIKNHTVRHVLLRIVQAVLVLWAAYTVTYIILNLLPADPLALILQAQGADISTLSASQIATLRHSYGLDTAPLQRYFTMLLAAIHGDFGNSYTYGTSVLHLIAVRVSSTIVISLLSILLSVVLSFALAFWVSLTRQHWLRKVLAALPAFAASVPSFWVGLLLMQIFCFWLGWLPSGGMKGPASMVLPVITMSVPTAAMLSQLLINGFESIMDSNYVTVARARGFSKRHILFAHVSKNASLPALTILGLLVGETVTGAIVAETVFSRQGLGMLIQQAVTNQDIPVVQGAVVLAAGAFVIVNLIVDLIYPLLDPRLTRTKEAIA